MARVRYSGIVSEEEAMKFFNTAGPVRCKIHYCLPPLERFDLEELLSLVDQEKYFVLHAPRQTGKTSCLLALMKYLNDRGKYKCLYCNVETGQSAREDVKRGMRAIIGEIASRARDFLDDEFPLSLMKEALELYGEDGALKELLSQWSKHSSKPLVLLMDEIDSLVGDTLISVLRQLRSGYDKRSSHFPKSVILCGVRDVRDYRIHSSREKDIITGGSAFNIKAESRRIGDFSREETDILYNAHTEETGQTFAREALDTVWTLSEGQPWLVNALGYEVCFEMKENRDRSVAITPEMIRRAGENLILRRETHIDQLADKLKEERVQRVIGPMLLGADMKNTRQDDIEYLIDLGLVRKSPAGLKIANAIYREVIPRELIQVTQYNLEPRFKPLEYVLPNGRLDVEKLMAAFQDFFREHSEHWVERFQYKEAGPQLLLQAFLQRIVNSGGRVEREYGLGRKRTDLLLIWFHGSKVQKAVIELKILYKSLEATMEEGLEQIWGYMDKCGTKDGHLVIFDRSAKPWSGKIFRKTETHKGAEIIVWGM